MEQTPSPQGDVQPILPAGPLPHARPPAGATLKVQPGLYSSCLRHVSTAMLREHLHDCQEFAPQEPPSKIMQCFPRSILSAVQAVSDQPGLWLGEVPKLLTAITSSPEGAPATELTVDHSGQP